MLYTMNLEFLTMVRNDPEVKSALKKQEWKEIYRFNRSRARRGKKLLGEGDRIPLSVIEATAAYVNGPVPNAKVLRKYWETCFKTATAKWYGVPKTSHKEAKEWLRRGRAAFPGSYPLP